MVVPNFWDVLCCVCFFFVVVFSWSMDAIGGLGLFSFIAKVGG
jgi:hypothetical protein